MLGTGTETSDTQRPAQRPAQRYPPMNMLQEIHRQSLQHLLASIPSDDPNLCLIPDLPLSPGHVLEIQGAPASGKTHLIYALLMSCIIPVTYGDAAIALGGWSKAAIIFDTDHSFDLGRLKELLTSRLALPLKSDRHSESLQTLVDRCLKSVHIFRPTTSAQLASALLHLPLYHTTHLPDAQIGMIAIDSISAFYWPDRFHVEQMRLTRKPEQAAHHLRHVLTALQRFRLSHKPLMVLSNWGLTLTSHTDSPSNAAFYKQHLHPFPSPFAENGDPVGATAVADPPHDNSLTVTHHITLTSTPALEPRHGPGYSVDSEGEEGLGKRERGCVAGRVRIPGVPEITHFNFAIKGNVLSFWGADSV
uniref:RecA family profile 1 domain-containing protein n=1 Tax=Moniliophthora roreri TaxID=221103 RepID=A0A0W0G2N5_MONRR